MPVSFDKIEEAYFLTGSDREFMNQAVLCRETGKIFYSSEMADIDEMPDDIDDPKYISIPHKHDLDLGKVLVFDFVEEFMPEEADRVYDIFRKRGAYSRFKDLLDRKGLLDSWHSFEDKKTKQALRQWCMDNDIELI